MKNFSYLLGFVFILCILNAQSQERVLRSNWWIPNDAVNDIVKDTLNNRLIVSGRFSRVAPPHYYGITADRNNHKLHYSFSQPNDEVFASVADGKGGWYIGGAFSTVGSAKRKGLAHINRYGQVSDLFEGIGFDNSVESMALKGDTLYVGGDFERVGSLNSFGAGINKATAFTNVQYPDANSRINAIIDDGNGGFYIAGYFDKIGDSSRSKLAHILSDGTVGPKLVAENFEGFIETLELKDSTLYIGGNFSTTGGVQRENIAAINLNTNSFTTWRPLVDNTVYAIALSDSMVYFGGDFDTVNARPRLNFTAVEQNDGSSLPRFINVTGIIINVFGATAPGEVYSLERRDSILYIGGDFARIAGRDRGNFATINLNSGQIGNDVIDFDDEIRSIFPTDSLIYLGGYFDKVNNISRTKVAALSTDSLLLDSLKLDISRNVYSLSANDSILYIAGAFIQVDGIDRNYLAAYDLNNSSITDWNPNPDRAVVSIGENNSVIYLGGIFRNIGGMARKKLVEIDLSADSVTNLELNLHHPVMELELNDELLFISEDSISGISRSFISKYEFNTGNLTRLGLNPNRTVRSLLLKDSILYIGGNFYNMGSISKDKLAAFDIKNDSLTNLGLTIPGSVADIVATDSSLFISGNFNSINGIARNFLAEIELSTGTVTSWDAAIHDRSGNTVNVMALTDSSLIIGGNLDSINGQVRHQFAELDLLTANLKSFDPGPNDLVHTLTISDDVLFIGGAYSAIGGLIRNNMMALNPETGVPTDWNPQINDVVGDMQIKNNVLYFIGPFTSVYNQAKDQIAAINLTADTLATLNLGFSNTPYNGFVSTFAISGDTLFVGGSFNRANGIFRRRLLAFDLQSQSLLAWNPRPSNSISDIAIHNGKLYVAGSFSSFSTPPVSRDRIAEFNLASLTFTSWDPDVNRSVYDISVNDSIIYIGGYFTSVNNTNRNYFAAFNNRTSNRYLLSLNLNASDDITHFSEIDNSLFIVGRFNSIGGNGRRRFAEFNTINSEITDFRLDLDLQPNVITKSDSFLLIGGSFQEVNDVRRPFLLAFSSPCTTEESVDTVTHCGNSFTWIDGYTYYGNTNAPKFTFINKIGCDSVVQLNLTLLAPSDSTISISQCEPYAWVQNNQTYNFSGSYSDTLVNSEGCDSIVTLNLSINKSYAVETVIACDTFTWRNGIQYTNSTASVYDTIMNAAGCDSIIQLDLTINQSTSSIDTLIACDSLVWIDGVTYRSSTNAPTIILNGSNGCDSVVTLNLTINQSIHTFDSISACDNYTWTNGVTYTSSNNTAQQLLTAANGCDSLVTLQLSLNYSSDTTLNVVSCGPYVWPQTNLTYTNSGFYRDTISNQFGCDSLLTLNLNIALDSSIETIAACDSFLWTNGTVYYSSTTVPKDTFINSFGCDSIVQLNLTINQSTTSVDSINSCSPVTWIDGITYSSSTNSPSFIISNSQGCDSVVQLDLTIIPFNNTINIVGDTLYTNQSGSAYQWLNCDSLNRAISSATNNYFVPQFSGNYSCEVATTNCLDTTACYNKIVSSSGNQVSGVNFNPLNIYPNPANTVLFIEGLTPQSDVALHTLEGKVVLRKAILSAESKIQLEVSGLSEGVYFISIINQNNEQLWHKVVIQ